MSLPPPTDLRPPRGLPARSPSALRASLGASSRSPARPRRPRGGLQSAGAGHDPARPRRPRGGLQSGGAGNDPARPRRPRGGLQSGGAGHDPAGPRPLPRAPQSGPAVRPRRPRDDRLLNNVARNSRASISNTEIASLELQRFEHILKTDRCKLRATFARGYVVPRRTDDETPLADAVRSLWPTQVRPPSASTAPRQRTRRSTPRRRWGGSSRAGGPGAGSTGAPR